MEVNKSINEKKQSSKENYTVKLFYSNTRTMKEIITERMLEAIRDELVK